MGHYALKTLKREKMRDFEGRAILQVLTVSAWKSPVNVTEELDWQQPLLAGIPRSRPFFFQL